MNHEDKTAGQLLRELDSLRRRVEELEALERQNRQINEELLLFKSIVEASHEAIAISDPGGGLLYINPAHEKLFGHSLEEAKELNYRDYYPPESVEVLNREVAPALERGESWEGELEVFHASGRRFPLWERADSVRDADGRMLYAFGFMHDITPRKHLEQRLQETIELNEKIFAASPLGICAYKMGTGECVLANDAAAHIIGASREEVLQQNFYHIKSWQASGLLETANRALASHREERQEIHTTSACGKEVWLDCRFITFIFQGEPHLLLVFEDITQRKQAELAVENYRQELEKQVQERTLELSRANAELQKKISERRQTEASLKSERDFVGALLDTVGALVVILDRSGRIVRFNHICEAATGYGRAEVLGREFWDIFLLPEEREGVVEVFQKLTAGQFPSTYENYWLTKDGGKTLISWSNTALVDNDNQVTYIIGTGIDVTASRQAEEALKESEQRYSSLFENNHAVMLLIDPDTANIVDANPAACSFYGLSRVELTTRKITDINTLTPDQIFQEMQRARSRDRQVFHFKHRLATGDLRDVEVYSGPIEVQGRQLLYSIVHDITERKRAEEALRESEDRFRILVEQSFDGIFVHEDFRIVDLNKRLADITGYSRSELLHMRAIDLFTPDSQKCINDYIRSGRKGYYDLELRRKDGRIVQTESFGAPCTFHGREARIVALRDITERKQAEEALRRSQRQQKALIDNIPDIAWLKDRESRFIAVNEPFGLACGVRPQDLVGQTDLDIWPTDLAERYRADDREVMESQTRKQVEEPLVDKDGRTTWIETIKTPIFDDKGEVIGTTGIARDITDRLKAEEALRASEEKYRLLVQSIPAVVYKGYADWSVDFVDDKIKELSGYSKADFDSRRLKWCDVVLPEDLPALKEVIKQALETTRSYVREYRIRNRAGKIRWIQARAQIICDSKGKIDYITGVFFDITPQKELEAELRGYRDHLEKLVERRTNALTQVNKKLLEEIAERGRTEMALRESEEKYRTIVETSQEGIWVIDTENKTSYVNRRMGEMLGYEPEEMLGTHLFQFMNEEGRQKAEENLRRGYQGLREVLEFQFHRKDGSDLWTIISTNPLFDANGNYAGALGMITDITERRRAEMALRESEARFRKIFEESPIGIALRDLEGRLLESNPALMRITGYNTAEMQRLSFDQFIHPKDEPWRQRLFQELTAGEQDFYTAEMRFFKKDGTMRWALSHASLVRDEAGSPLYYLAMVQDITREKQAEAELAAYQENLRSLASELSLTEERERCRLAEFLHDDIGQTLAMAKIKLGELNQEVSEPQGISAVNEVGDFLEQAIRSTRNLTFELSLPILYEMGLEEAVEWLAEQFQNQHHLAITVSRDGQPKPLNEGARVILFRLVRELLTNVVKHAQARQAWIAFTREDDYLRIHLKDDGIGFDVTQRPPLSPSAVGFGLFSLRERLSHLGGLMEVRSAPGQGTEVTISVPLKDTETLPPVW